MVGLFAACGGDDGQQAATPLPNNQICGVGVPAQYCMQYQNGCQNGFSPFYNGNMYGNMYGNGMYNPYQYGQVGYPYYGNQNIYGQNPYGNQFTCINNNFYRNQWGQYYNPQQFYGQNQQFGNINGYGGQQLCIVGQTPCNCRPFYPGQQTGVCAI